MAEILEKWSSLWIPFAFVLLFFFFLDPKDKENNTVKSQVRTEQKASSTKKEHLFYLSRVALPWKAIKREQFFLKWLLAKIWGSLSAIRNVKAFGLQWFVKGMIKPCSWQTLDLAIGAHFLKIMMTKVLWIVMIAGKNLSLLC